MYVCTVKLGICVNWRQPMLTDAKFREAERTAIVYSPPTAHGSVKTVRNQTINLVSEAADNSWGFQPVPVVPEITRICRFIPPLAVRGCNWVSQVNQQGNMGNNLPWVCPKILQEIKFEFCSKIPEPSNIKKFWNKRKISLYLNTKLTYTLSQNLYSTNRNLGEII